MYLMLHSSPYLGPGTEFSLGSQRQRPGKALAFSMNSSKGSLSLKLKTKSTVEGSDMAEPFYERKANRRSDSWQDSLKEVES
jgi:hypothetical protein